MRKLHALLLLVLVLAISIGFAGCAQLNRNTQNVKVTATKTPGMPENTTNVRTNKATKVFFYYSSECPTCRMVKKYMDLVRKVDSNKVAFYYCDVVNTKNCSNLSLWVAKHINLSGRSLPVVIITHGNGIYMQILEGLDAAKTGLILHEFGLPMPKARLNNTTYSTAICLGCHLQKGFLPKEYNCTYCCHLSKANNSTMNTYNNTSGNSSMSKAKKIKK